MTKLKPISCTEDYQNRYGFLLKKRSHYLGSLLHTDSLVGGLYQQIRTIERHRHRYEMNNQFFAKIPDVVPTNDTAGCHYKKTISSTLGAVS